MDFLMLLLGGSLLGLGGVFVRLAGAAGVGPFASAFWRMALGAGVLIVWEWTAKRRRAARASAAAVTSANAPLDAELEPALEQPPTPAPGWLRGWSQPALIALAASNFAVDLMLYHLGLSWTSVANATLESNLAPVLITIVLWRVTRVAPRPMFLLGMFAALFGAMLMIGPHLGHGVALLGDLSALGSAVFYAAYQLAVQQARQRLGTLELMAWVSACAALVLLPVAWLEGPLLPAAPVGWVWLVALALLVQIGGQVLIAHAIKHLHPGLASVGLLMQPATAGVYAWAILGQAMGAAQIAGIVLALAGIYLARRWG